MATEVQSGDLNSANSSRLEVSIDGLTLSPDSEGEQEQAETSAGQPAGQSAGNPELSGDGEEGEPASSGSIERKWGFSLVELYGLALRFFKEKDGKAFHPTYEDKLRLVALHKQVLQGPYNPDASPEVGFFDVLGNDRRKEWASLGNMEKDEAMLEFVNLLNKCCSLFAPFVTSHKIEKEEQERKRRREEEEQRRREEEERERLRQEEERRRHEEEERLRREEEERRQVEEERFRIEQQKLEYTTQLLSRIRAALQKQQEDAIVLSTLEASEVSAPSAGEEAPTLNGQAESTTDSLEREPDLEPADQVTENGPTDSPPVIAAPSMWTRPQIKDFKEKIRQDVDSVITVGRGEVVTVRVPTHEEGSYLFWEFATDYYDVGFGVFFEWTDSTNASVSVHVSESSDEGEDEEGEGQSEDEKAKKEAGKPQVDEVVPVYRRDCHEEVYAGSHQYPGRGIYLLKFDNSYSLWRSKTVYYRVYYTR
ncbi:hypothetical protein cypCar_00011334 [Cyprinus carpio]|nr:hypothetical protein cypCar_00011334 [Cyprinus carpio]